MCLLTYISPGVLPDMADLETGGLNNPDGHGWAILAHGEIHVGHSMDIDVALTLFEIAREAMPEGPALFHSRIATAGNIDTFNCHPFYVNGDRRTVLAHNGILPRSAQPSLKDPRSDTHLFADVWLPKQNYGHFYSRSGRKRLRRWMGAGNKMAILTVDPAYSAQAYIINEHLGEWVDGVWFSNTSWRDEPWWTRYPASEKWVQDEFGDWMPEGGWRDDDFKAASEKVTGTIIGNPKPLNEPLQITSGPSQADPMRDVACAHCQTVGMIGSITYACHSCHTCQVCDKGVDDCKCDMGARWGAFEEESRELANEQANEDALQADRDRDMIAELEREGTWGNDGLWRAD